MNFTMKFSNLKILRYPKPSLGSSSWVGHYQRSDDVGGASGYIFVVDNGSFEARKKTSKRVDSSTTQGVQCRSRQDDPSRLSKYSSLESAETNGKSIFDIFGLVGKIILRNFHVIPIPNQ